MNIKFSVDKNANDLICITAAIVVGFLIVFAVCFFDKFSEKETMFPFPEVNYETIEKSAKAYCNLDIGDIYSVYDNDGHIISITSNKESGCNGLSMVTLIGYGFIKESDGFLLAAQDKTNFIIYKDRDNRQFSVY